MNHPDPFLYPFVFLQPESWSKRIAPLLADPSATEAAIDALMAEQSFVPTFLRKPGDAFSLYEHGGKTDARLKLMSVLPITGSPSKQQLTKVLADPHARHVEGFDLREKGAAKALVAGLAASAIERVRFLDAHDSGLPSPDELAALLASPKLAALERLGLGGAALKDRFLTVARMPATASVRALFLGGCEKLAKSDFQAFAAAAWPKLESLQIGSSTHEPKEGSRDALWKAPWLERIRRLSILGLLPTEARTLADSGVLPKLETFLVSATKLREEDVRPLLPQLRSCIALNLSGKIGIESAKALIASECVPNLEACELDLTPDARAALVEAGLDVAGVKARRAAERGYTFRI
jgi:hypothetical protein